MFTKFRLNWVCELHAHLCPYCNVWPEGLLLFYKNCNLYRIVVHFSIIRVIGFYHFTKFHCSTLSSSEIHVANVLPEGVYYIFYNNYIAMFTTYRNIWPETVYCCFTRTIILLFTKMLT